MYLLYVLPIIKISSLSHVRIRIDSIQSVSFHSSAIRGDPLALAGLHFWLLKTFRRKCVWHAKWFGQVNLQF